MLIFPAIDIRNGRCVRLRQGRFDHETVYADSPQEVAWEFARMGFRHLHVVDLDGARTGRPVNTGIVRDIAAIRSLQVQVGGGLRSEEAVRSMLETGVGRVILGSVALQQQESVQRWIAEIGPGRFALAADVRDGRIASHGWGATSDVTVETVMRSYLGKGLTRVICTDISRDGMMTGPSFGLYERLLRIFPEAELIASGGVSSMEDIRRLEALGVYGAIVGTAIYDGSIEPRELVPFNGNGG